MSYDTSSRHASRDDDERRWKTDKSRDRDYDRDRHSRDRHADRDRERERERDREREREHRHQSRDHSDHSDQRRRRRSRSRSASPSPSLSASRSRSPSRSPSRSRSGSPMALSRQLERQRRKEEKARLKALETPEQKRARRLAKKEAKALKRRERMGEEGGVGADGAAAGGAYSNTDNPFNDTNLSQKFVWHKKIESAEEQGITRDELLRKERERARENRLEIERMKQRRQERERELEKAQAERDALLRAQEDAQFGQWVQQEDHFQLEQARLRSQIRVREGRARPIDLLAKYLNSDPDDPTDIEMHEPYSVFAAMNEADCEDLREDIRVYRRMEAHLPSHCEFWDDILIICNHELEAHRRQRAQEDPNLSAAERRALETGINERIKGEILSLIQDKTYTQLQEMEKQIRAKLDSGEAVDVVYWETLLRELKVQCAKARLRERHQDLLQHKLDLLRQQALQAPAAAETADQEDNVYAQAAAMAAAAEAERQARRQEREGRMADKKAGHDHMGAMAADDSDRPASPPLPPEAFSPRPQAPREGIDFPEEFVSQEYLDRQLLSLRRKVFRMVLENRILELHPDFCKNAADSGLSEADRMFFEKARRLDAPDSDAEEGDEALEFASEVKLDKREDDYMWRDKYQPRKPRFFNRVFTGFEWNQYNRTHYDRDNPPPKMVQGYKFNIFYPDLIDRTQIPKYKVTPIPDEPGFAIIKFSAGPPYEDIAFKIVDRKWSHDRRSGYKCQFTANNIFELHFRFRRERYRR